MGLLNRKDHLSSKNYIGAPLDFTLLTHLNVRQLKGACFDEGHEKTLLLQHRLRHLQS